MLISRSEARKGAGEWRTKGWALARSPWFGLTSLSRDDNDAFTHSDEDQDKDPVCLPGIGRANSRIFEFILGHSWMVSAFVR